MKMSLREPTQEERDRVLGQLARKILDAFEIPQEEGSIARIRGLIDNPPNREIEKMILSFVRETQEKYLNKIRGLIVCCNGDCDGSCWFAINECDLGTDCPYCGKECNIVEIKRKHMLPWFVGPANFIQSSHMMQALMLRDMLQSLGAQISVRLVADGSDSRMVAVDESDDQIPSQSELEEEYGEDI